jgi:hypothetical protein
MPMSGIGTILKTTVFRRVSATRGIWNYQRHFRRRTPTSAHRCVGPTRASARELNVPAMGQEATLRVRAGRPPQSTNVVPSSGVGSENLVGCGNRFQTNALIYARPEVRAGLARRNCDAKEISDRNSEWRSPTRSRNGKEIGDWESAQRSPPRSRNV